MQISKTAAIIASVFSLILTACDSGKPVSQASPETDKAAIKKSFEAKKERVDAVNNTPIPGVYEVVIGGKTLFTDKAATHVIVGDMYEADTQKNLTMTRMINDLPLDKAIKTVNGSGARKIVTIEDPNCGYCRKLFAEFKNVPDVTIYTFVIPLLGEDSLDKTKRILCSANPSEAWSKWMTAKEEPVAAEGCDPTSALRANVGVAKGLGVKGTPFMIFSDGTIMNGYIPADRINAILK